jgi:hypothetical protein
MEKTVKSTVPQEMWGAIVEKLDRVEQHPEALDVVEEDFDDDDPMTRPSSSTRTTSFDLRSGPTASSDRRPRHRRPSCWRSILTAGAARLDRDDLESVLRLIWPSMAELHACSHLSQRRTSGPRRRGVR